MAALASDKALASMFDPMEKTIVLLRGINVGGHPRLPIAELRRREGRGAGRIETYIQSGNLVFAAKSAAAAEAAIEALAGSIVTMRNWRTVLKLAEMVG